MAATGGLTERSLFGGHMTVQLPADIVDVSDLREIPDNQEVYSHMHTDQSLIIEILEIVEQPDDEALKVHFEDLAGANEAGGPETSRILSVEPLPITSMTQCKSAYLLCGQQFVAKFKETARNTVNIYMGLFRLPQFATDILVTFNDPVIISEESSSKIAENINPWTLPQFREVLQSLTVRNEQLFGQ